MMPRWPIRIKNLYIPVICLSLAGENKELQMWIGKCDAELDCEFLVRTSLTSIFLSLLVALRILYGFMGLLHNNVVITKCDQMIKQLLNSVITKYCDLSVSQWLLNLFRKSTNNDFLYLLFTSGNK